MLWSIPGQFLQDTCRTGCASPTATANSCWMTSPGARYRMAELLGSGVPAVTTAIDTLDGLDVGTDLGIERGSQVEHWQVAEDGALTRDGQVLAPGS